MQDNACVSPRTKSGGVLRGTYCVYTNVLHQVAGADCGGTYRNIITKPRTRWLGSCRQLCAAGTTLRIEQHGRLRAIASPTTQSDLPRSVSTSITTPRMSNHSPRPRHARCITLHRYRAKYPAKTTDERAHSLSSVCNPEAPPTLVLGAAGVRGHVLALMSTVTVWLASEAQPVRPA